MTQIKSTPVFRCLGKRLLILGFEIPELLLVSMVLGVCHIFFHELESGFWLTWTPPAFICVGLKLVRRFSDDGFMLHWLKYQMSPGYYTAFLPMEVFDKRRGK